jgi:hypothetical protein
MTSLLGILAYVAAVAGFGATYWWFERRTGEEKSSPAAPLSDRPRVSPVVQPSDSALKGQEKEHESDKFPPFTESPTTAKPLAEEVSPVTPTVSQPIKPTIPSTDATLPAENLLAIERTIGLWGAVGQSSHIPALAKFSTHADSNIRVAVATALGKIALKQRGIAMERMVPLLGKLSQDVNQQVQLSAIAALGNIRSTTVLPWLQRALRSPNGRINKAASLALQRLQLKSLSKPAKPARVPIQPRK